MVTLLHPKWQVNSINKNNQWFSFCTFSRPCTNYPWLRNMLHLWGLLWNACIGTTVSWHGKKLPALRNNFRNHAHHITTTLGGGLRREIIKCQYWHHLIHHSITNTPKHYDWYSQFVYENSDLYKYNGLHFVLSVASKHLLSDCIWMNDL